VIPKALDPILEEPDMGVFGVKPRLSGENMETGDLDPRPFQGFHDPIPRSLHGVPVGDDADTGTAKEFVQKAGYPGNGVLFKEKFAGLTGKVQAIFQAWRGKRILVAHGLLYHAFEDILKRMVLKGWDYYKHIDVDRCRSRRMYGCSGGG
jgi:hypothetical protein